MSNIKKLMEDAFSKTPIDDKLFAKLQEFKQLFINRDDEHIKFFGGNLLGVNPIKFLPRDKNELLDVIFQVDEDHIKDSAKKLPSMKNEDWIRYTDPVNLCCLYLVHRIYKLPVTNKFTDKDKEKALLSVLLILQFKFFSSLLSHYFPFKADEATALATYAVLSKKYAIKQHGNWLNVLINRSQNIISEDSTHINTITNFDTDEDIFYMISDIQGRLKEMVKKIWAVFAEIREMNIKILSTGGTIELDGKTVIRDISNELANRRRYINEVIKERNRFVKPELVSVITSAMYTMPEQVLFNTLNYIVDNYNDKRVTSLIDETLLHAFEYLNSDRRAKAAMDDILQLITKLRALYMASRSSDPGLLKMRELGESIVKSATVGRSAAVIASVRTGLLLYIVLRTFSMRHYG